jgi:topoisomerase-4 subunit A
LTNFELTNRYPAEEIMYLKKFEPQAIISAAYFDGSNKTHLIKRFHLETTSLDKKFLFISDHKASKLIAVTDNYAPNVQIKHKPDGKTNELEIIPIDDLAEVQMDMDAWVEVLIRLIDSFFLSGGNKSAPND